MQADRSSLKATTAQIVSTEGYVRTLLGTIDSLQIQVHECKQAADAAAEEKNAIKSSLDVKESVVRAQLLELEDLRAVRKVQTASHDHLTADLVGLRTECDRLRQQHREAQTESTRLLEEGQVRDSVSLLKVGQHASGCMHSSIRCV